MKAAVKITMLVEIEKYVERKVFREEYPSKRERERERRRRRIKCRNYKTQKKT